MMWLGITLGKIAWGHFYVMAYPLTAIAWLVARQQGGRQGRYLELMFWLVGVSCVVHYSLASGPRLSDIGGILLPMSVLAVATVAAASCQGKRIGG